MGFRELLKTPVKDLLKVNARSSARALYLAAAAILGVSAACDVLPTSGTVRDLAKRSEAFTQADACLQARVDELGLFEQRSADLIKKLRPYVHHDPSSEYFRNEYEQRVRYRDVAFVHSNLPTQVNTLPSPGATPTPDTFAEPMHGPTHGPTPDPIVVRTVAKAETCLAALHPATPDPQASGGQATPTPTPVLRAFRGNRFELELHGGTQDTLSVNAALSQTNAAISARDVDFKVMEDDRIRLLSSQTMIGLYRIVLPSPVPTPSISPAPTLTLSPSPTSSVSVSASPNAAASPTAGGQ